MACDPIKAENFAYRIVAAGAFIVLVAVGVAFGPLVALATLCAMVFLFGLSYLISLPPLA